MTKAVSEISKLIEKSKDENCYCLNKKLTGSRVSAKSYWTILKTFYDKREIPLIPLFLFNNIFVTDFK